MCIGVMSRGALSHRRNDKKGRKERSSARVDHTEFNLTVMHFCSHQHEVTKQPMWVQSLTWRPLPTKQSHMDQVRN